MSVVPLAVCDFLWQKILFVSQIIAGPTDHMKPALLFHFYSFMHAQRNEGDMILGAFRVSR